MALAVPKPEGAAPVATGKDSGTIIVLEHARELLARQSQSYDALDSKAATLIGATLVVLGLVLPNVDADEAIHWAALIVFLVVIAYALLASFAAYSVTKLKVGVSARTLTSAMTRDEGTARAAVTVHLLRKYVENRPAIERKAALVLRGLIALGVAIPALVALAISGALD